MSASSSTPHLKSKTTLCQAWSPSPSLGELHLERGGAGGSCRDRFAKDGAGDQQEPGVREHLRSLGARALTHRPPFPSRSWDARQPLGCSLVLCLRFEG